MIEYIVAQSPDFRKLKAASNCLKNGGLVALPTDTNWIIACDPFSKAGVEKLYKIKKADPSKHFSVLCDTISRASQIANIHDLAFRLIRNKVPGHYTFIFEALKKIKKHLKASKTDHEVGIRFPPRILAAKLIQTHGDVLLSTNVTHEILGLQDESIDIYPFLIEESLPGIIDIILDPGEYDFVGQSTIVNFTDPREHKVEREGAGDPSAFN